MTELLPTSVRLTEGVSPVLDTVYSIGKLCDFPYSESGEKIRFAEQVSNFCSLSCFFPLCSLCQMHHQT